MTRDGALVFARRDRLPDVRFRWAKLGTTVALLSLPLVAGCSIGDLLDALDNQYYHVSGGNGV